MKIINAVIDSESNLVISPSEGFVGEQNAEMIEIDIGHFAQEGYDFYVINFDNGISGGMFPSNVISTAQDRPAYIDNGVIYCPIIASLTASGNLKLQLEAHKTVDNRVTVKKTSVASISFGESLMGQVNTPIESNPVYERLADAEGRIADAEGRIASAESRIAGIEKENFGSAIDRADERITLLERKTEATDKLAEKTISRVSALENHELPKKIESIDKRIEELENSDVLTSVPAADDKTLGGVKISGSSEVVVNKNGFLGLNYGNVEMHSLLTLVTIALLYENGRVETVIGNTTEGISSTVFGLSMQIVNGAIEAVAFSTFENGEIVWFDENYEQQSTDITANQVYVLRLSDGVMVIESYSGNELRNLILGGI